MSGLYRKLLKPRRLHFPPFPQNGTVERSPHFLVSTYSNIDALYFGEQRASIIIGGNSFHDYLSTSGCSCVNNKRIRIADRSVNDLVATEPLSLRS